MTEDQKAVSLILDLLKASQKVPRTLHWVSQEVRLCGRLVEVPTILEHMEEGKLIASEKDGLGLRRYSITAKGREVLDEL